jgi:Cytochrome c7 and related cytochrome c
MLVRSERIILVMRFVLACFVVVAFFSNLQLHAQQSAGSGDATKFDAKKEVPDNLAVHMPPAQPIPYSHQTHLALGLECSGCHANPEPGNLMTFPATSTCMSCHNVVAAEKPSIKKLASYEKSGQPIPWVRIYIVTSGVNWTHRKHLGVGIKCEICHGPVEEMAAMSMATSVTSMGVCINCHTLHNAPTTCQTCHAWPAN